MIPDDPYRTAGYDELPLDDYVDETQREHDADSVNDMEKSA